MQGPRGEHERCLHQTGHRIENCFAHLKQYQAVAMRFGKKIRNLLGITHLTEAMVGLA